MALKFSDISFTDTCVSIDLEAALQRHYSNWITYEKLVCNPITFNCDGFLTYDGSGRPHGCGCYKFMGHCRLDTGKNMSIASYNWEKIHIGPLDHTHLALHISRIHGTLDGWSLIRSMNCVNNSRMYEIYGLRDFGAILPALDNYLVYYSMREYNLWFRLGSCTSAVIKYGDAKMLKFHISRANSSRAKIYLTHVKNNHNYYYNNSKYILRLQTDGTRVIKYHRTDDLRIDDLRMINRKERLTVDYDSITRKLTVDRYAAREQQKRGRTKTVFDMTIDYDVFNIDIANHRVLIAYLGQMLTSLQYCL